MKDEKKELKRRHPDFLQARNKLYSKKKRQKKRSKQKASIKETSWKKATISNVDTSDKIEFPVSIPSTKILKSKIKDIDIVMISKDAYCTVCSLK